MAQQKIVIPISPKHSKKVRLAIAKEVIDHIIERTRKENKDKDGEPLAPYKSSYTKSLNYTIAKGNSKRVDLTLTGEMLDSLKLLNDRKGAITIGYDGRSKKLNGKVEGNRLGTYGNDKPVAKPRDFLGIQDEVLEDIEEQYLDNETKEEKLSELDLIDRKVDEIIGGRIIFEDEND